MVHLVATVANDADRMPSLLYALRNEVVVPESTALLETWGVGYYAEDRALIIRKPAELLSTRSIFELAPNVQSGIVLACVQRDAPQREHAPHELPHPVRRLDSATPSAQRVLVDCDRDTQGRRGVSCG